MTEFKLGTEVFIPGTIREVMGPEVVVVETKAGIVVITRPCNLEMAQSRDAPIEERVERLARAMCGADSVDPDERAYIGQPLLVGPGYVAHSGMFEAWRLYAKYAQALIDKGLA